jgi:hypothetical protein
MEIDEIFYGRYATGNFSKLAFSDSLFCVIPFWRNFKVTRWDNDDSISHALAHDLRMRITNQTLSNQTSSQLTSVCTNLITGEWLDGN